MQGPTTAGSKPRSGVLRVICCGVGAVGIAVGAWIGTAELRFRHSIAALTRLDGVQRSAELERLQYQVQRAASWPWIESAYLRAAEDLVRSGESEGARLDAALMVLAAARVSADGVLTWRRIVRDVRIPDETRVRCIDLVGSDRSPLSDLIGDTLIDVALDRAESESLRRAAVLWLVEYRPQTPETGTLLLVLAGDCEVPSRIRRSCIDALPLRIASGVELEGLASTATDERDHTVRESLIRLRDRIRRR